MFTPDVAVVYMLGMTAFYFYITKTPEKCFPGIVFINNSTTAVRPLSQWSVVNYKQTIAVILATRL